jgi:hypothetical protein
LALEAQETVDLHAAQRRRRRKNHFQLIPIREGKENTMIGAIAGDIIGSVYEQGRIKRKDFPFLIRSAGSRMILCLPSPLRRLFWKGRATRKPSRGSD